MKVTYNDNKFISFPSSFGTVPDSALATKLLIYQTPKKKRERLTNIRCTISYPMSLKSKFRQAYRYCMRVRLAMDADKLPVK